MNRMIRGMAGLLVALGASACVTDPSVDYANDPSTIVLDPEVMFVTHGTEKQMFARLVDERNRATPTEFQISNIGAGLTVRVDSQYRVDYINGDSLSWRPIQHQHRVWVGSSAPTGVMGTFRIASSGISKDVTVRVLPANLGAAVSSANPSIGEVVTVTAPANLSFTDVATVALVDGNTVVNAVVTDRTAKTVSFVPMPGSTGVVRVTGVTLDYAPTLASRTLATTSTVTVPADDAVPVLSATNPAVGDVVTVTAGPGQAFAANATVTFTPGGAAVITNRTATTISFYPRPGSQGKATVTGVTLTPGQGSVLGSFTKQTSNSINVAAVNTMPLTLSATTPLTPVTMTSAGFKFLPTMSFTIGGKQGYVVSVAPDSNSASVVLPADASGVPSLSNVSLAFLPTVGIANVAGGGNVTTATTTWNGGVADGTAPVINAAAPGTEVIFYDTWINQSGAFSGFWGGAGKMYRVEVPSAGARTITLRWTSNADMDIVVTPTGVLADYVAVAASTANPETINYTFPAAGTYWIGVGNYQNGTAPGVVRISIK